MNKYYNEVSDTIKAIVNNGFELIKVDYERGFGKDEGHDYVDCRPIWGWAAIDEKLIRNATDAVLAVDEAHLYIKTPKGGEQWVFFVLGNDDGEAVNDWLIPSDKDEAAALEAAISEVSDKYMEVAG